MFYYDYFQESARTVFMRRDDLTQGITKLCHSDGTDNWLVVRELMTNASQVSYFNMHFLALCLFAV